MKDLVPIRRGKPTQVSLADIQERLDARALLAKARSTTSTRKSRVEGAKRSLELDALGVLVEIQNLAQSLADLFDAEIAVDGVPLSQDQINTLSDEYLRFDKLKVELEALEGRYRSLIFAHLDETGPKIPGRPASQVPGKVEASGPGPRYVFERRGGNRANPELDTDALREALPEELAAQVYVTVHHDPVPAWDEEVFDEGRFCELVDAGRIDLDVVAEHLTPGAWRTPSFYKTLVEG